MSFDIGNYNYSLVTGSTCQLNGFKTGNAISNIVVEATVIRNGTTLTVVRIKDNAFNNGLLVNSLTFNGTSITILDAAFAGHLSGISVLLPNTTVLVGAPFDSDVILTSNLSDANFYYVLSSATQCTILAPRNANPLTIAKTVILNATTYTITSIAPNAFNSGLETEQVLDIPNTIATIGDGAFYATAITSLTFEENSTITDIGVLAFADCNSLSGVLTIPSSVTTIGSIQVPEDPVPELSGAFQNTNITGVVFQGQLMVLGDNTFANSIKIEGPINIPMGIAGQIGSQIFTNCNLLISQFIEITGSLFVTISDTAFAVIYENGSDNITGPIVITENSPVFITGDFKYTIPFNRGLRDLCAVSELTTTATSLTIPFSSNFNGDPYEVLGIRANAFTDNTTITSLTISQGVGGFKFRNIGQGAFSGCTGLKGGIIIPYSVFFVGASAFEGTSITSLEFYHGGGVQIGNFAFKNCVELTGTFTVVSSITSIGTEAFRGTGIQSLKFVDDFGDSLLTNIGVSAFADCLSLNSVVDATLIADNASIKDQAFHNCTDLVKQLVVLNPLISLVGTPFDALPNGPIVLLDAPITTIDTFSYNFPINNPNFPFYCVVVGVTNPTTNITIPANITTDKLYSTIAISSNVFINNTTITSVDFATTTEFTTIGGGAFKGCTSLSSFTPPGSLLYINEAAFQGTSALTSFTFNSGLLVIGGSAFSNSGLNSSLEPAASTRYIGANAFSGTQITSLAFSIGCQLQTIDDRAFFNIATLTGPVEIPALVVTLGENVFFGTKITGLTFANGSVLQTIGNGSFLQCTTLTGPLLLPASVISIGQTAFFQTSLTSVSFGDGSQLQTIGQTAFALCTKLTGDLNIKSQVDIQSFAFLNTSLTSITLSDSPISIGEKTFYGCKNLSNSEIDLSDTQVIGNYAFYGVGGNNVFGFPTAATSVGFQAFAESTVTVGPLPPNLSRFSRWSANNLNAYNWGTTPYRIIPTN